MTVVSESSSIAVDQTLTVGKLFVSAVNIPPGMTEPRFKGTSRVTTLDHSNFRVAWETPAGLLAWFLFAERWTMLTVEDGKTKSETLEVFRGIWVYIVYWIFYNKLVVSLQAMGEALKSRSEAA